MITSAFGREVADTKRLRILILQTDTGGQDENSKALERTQEKELGKLAP